MKVRALGCCCDRDPGGFDGSANNSGECRIIRSHERSSVPESVPGMSGHGRRSGRRCDRYDPPAHRRGAVLSEAVHTL
jgi:hypothetical protein